MSDDAVVEWFDSHCHLQDEFDEPTEGPVEPHADRLAATIARASEAGVTRLVCVGTGRDSSAEAVALARSLRRPGGPATAEGVALWATVGLHPHDAVDGVDGLDAVLAAEVTGGRIRPTGWSWPSASAGSTTTTTTRPDPCSARPSPSRSSWPIATAWPW